MKTIDLRSDTVTHPTQEMRKAMFEAKVGDDVYGEDPTVNLLELQAARCMGKEDALFTTSGTQSNLIAVLAQTHHGNEIILGNESHIFWYEVGGAAAIGGLVMHALPNDKYGRLNIDEIENAIRSPNIHHPETTLLCLENTHNRCGGTVLSVEYTKEVSDLAHSKGLNVHLDGARLFNASVALKAPVKSLTRSVDSVGVCLSKGLSAPVGSVLCGSKEFIKIARKYRKMLGGGMRQAGIIAAAGIVALNTMVDRLEEDHNNAKLLAKGLASIKGIILAQEEVQTNIVMFDLISTISHEGFVKSLDAANLKIGARDTNRFRAVTHRMISSADIDESLSRIETVCSKLRIT